MSHVITKLRQCPPDPHALILDEEWKVCITSLLYITMIMLCNPIHNDRGNKRAGLHHVALF